MSYVSEALEKQVETCKRLWEVYDGTGGMEPKFLNALNHSRVSSSERLQWLTDLNALTRATPYYWSGKTTELVRQSREAFNLDEIVVTRHLAHCDIGWMWFPDVPPFYIQMPDMEMQSPVKAITWYNFGHLPQTSDKVRPFLGLTAWCEGPYTHNLMPTLWACMDIGQPLSSQIEDSRLHFHGTYDDKTDGEIRAMKQFFVASQTFVRQKFFSLAEAPLERAARKRLERTGAKATFLERQIQVVQLRKTVQSPHHPSIEPREAPEWKEQWWVGQHTRQQWYPSLQEHLPVIILPYIKGPEGLPLKARTTPLYSVTR